ncbi:MAG: exopolysaccharide biosynthesis polyprenyl glycosylphosphotransferase, partial [Hyphomicrobiales bacterium]|nr:exopolysaccharide biosynthesis polyprenyl glycosylphosphotransferase [Hyphomicrobiales bacterium]
LRRNKVSYWGHLVKAIEDYVLGSLIMLVALPIFAVIAIAIKIDSPGPVFFRQRRHGLNHNIISIFKFRTMNVMEDGDEIKQAKKGDQRVTRVGAFLRKTSLDELPQLFNVLRGEMSLVGPRPHAIAHNNQYGEILKQASYASRHLVKPGITGWAQINGFRGPTDRPYLMRERVRCDLEYIDNWSIWFDLEILLLTLVYGFVAKNAY